MKSQSRSTEVVQSIIEIVFVMLPNMLALNWTGSKMGDLAPIRNRAGRGMRGVSWGRY
jgi:hypothetical protein